MANSLAFNRDCMEAMREFPDKFFDLAVVDPPYGDGLERERERENANSQQMLVAREGLLLPRSAGLVEPGRRSSEKNH